MLNPIEFAIDIGGKSILFQAGHVAEQQLVERDG